MENPFLLVGLGNPGIKYADTRHNVGFMVIDELARQCRGIFDESDAYYRLGRCQIEAISIILLKPKTYMNLSGLAIQHAISKYSVDTSRLLVVYDDLNLPFGKLRLRAKGSDGGHKGVSSIIFHLQSQNFPRLRIGIGARNEISKMVDFVLSPFDDEEKVYLPEMIQDACSACHMFVLDGLVKTMNTINKKLKTS